MALADILVPFDGSEEAEEALAEAVGLARDHEATLHLIGVPADQRRVRAGAPGEGAREVIDDALASVEVAGVNVEPFVVNHGNVDNAIKGYAVAHGIDLVVTRTGEGTRRPADREVRHLHADEDLAVLSL